MPARQPIAVGASTVQPGLQQRLTLLQAGPNRGQHVLISESKSRALNRLVEDSVQDAL